MLADTAGMEDRTLAIPVTLCFLRSGNRVLLQRVPQTKTRFQGLWNGIGGHVEPGEDVRAAALREIQEESSLASPELRLRAVIHETGLEAKAYLLFVFSGEVDGTPAPGRPELCWFREAEIPWEEVVPDLRVLLPRILHTEELVFGVQRFDGTDRSLELKLD